MAMKRALSYFTLCLVLVAGSRIDAHQGAINIFVDPDGVVGQNDVADQLYALEIFEYPQLQFFGGAAPEISFDGPGLSVNFPTQGVTSPAELFVDVSQDLKYWDGSGLAQPTVGIRALAPISDNQGNVNTSPVSEYFATADSGWLTGMEWGTYNGLNFWEAHGLKFLEPVTAPAGIYGLVYTVRSPQHEDSEPFVIPYIYDPNDEFDVATEQIGVDRLRASTAAHDLADLNRDGHADVDDFDLIVADVAAGLNSLEFDLTGDGIVDDKDMFEWRRLGGTANLPFADRYLAGDANLDGVVDVSDFNIWNESKFTSVAAWSAGDFNADGNVDVSDFNIWNGNKFQTAGLPPAATVPEPGSNLLLLMAGLAAVCCIRQRK